MHASFPRGVAPSSRSCCVRLLLFFPALRYRWLPAALWRVVPRHQSHQLLCGSATLPACCGAVLDRYLDFAELLRPTSSSFPGAVKFVCLRPTSSSFFPALSCRWLPDVVPGCLLGLLWVKKSICSARSRFPLRSLQLSFSGVLQVSSHHKIPLYGDGLGLARFHCATKQLPAFLQVLTLIANNIMQKLLFITKHRLSLASVL